MLKGVPFKVEVLRVGKLKGMGWRTRIAGAASLPGGLWRARALVRRLRPDVVVGFGGYTTGPVVLAAAMLGVPTAICEENSVPGLTNRLLARFARKVFVAYEQAGARLSAKRSIRTGVPVRPEVLEVPEKAYLQPGRRVLVFGGSQGSRFLNRRVPPVLRLLQKRLPGIEVLHQAGRGNGEEAREIYAALGMAADVREYLDDMAAAYAWADVVVARSGAGTVSEISAIGLPAMFVPFAAATDDHQAGNAVPLVEAGGGMMRREEAFDEAQVAGSLAALRGDPAAMQAMARASRSQGRRAALDAMGEEVLRMMGGKAGTSVSGDRAGG